MLQIEKNKAEYGSILMRSLMMPVQKICGFCEEEFLVPPRRSEEVKFCSIECKNRSNRVTLSCVACGTAFEVKQHLASTKYCSRPCYHGARVGVARVMPEGHQKHFKICEACSKSFRVTITRKDTARFCSKICMSESPSYRVEMGDVQRGENHWRWQGGRYKRGAGYVRVKGKSLASNKFHLEHRIVMEKVMLEMEPNHPFLITVDDQKKLDPKIDVHHIDRDRSHNDFDNLLAVTKHAHGQIHHKSKVPDPWECWPNSHATKQKLFGSTRLLKGGTYVQ